MRSPPFALSSALALAAALCALAAGCGNEAFDPESVPNRRPVARIFVAPPEGGELNPTSYFSRTFHWSGSDEDGFVQAYYVSIETEAGASAPWDTTAATDTTMTFETDDAGRAQALIRLACRDDRGAYSDTVSQYIPLRNFPPVINFVSDYDTFFWSYGAADFRCFALDLDGNVTMDDSVVYYLDTADTTLAPLPAGEPGANPALRPVIRRLDNLDLGTFQIDLHGEALPGERTLTIRVSDEADATTSFDWTWEVRAALSDVLLVDDSVGDYDRNFYYAAMDSLYGPGGWSLYEIAEGLPDRMWVLLETLRQFPVVFWYTGGGASPRLAAAAELIAQYVQPPAGHAPGKLLMVSPALIGVTGAPPPSFVTNTLGFRSTPDQSTFYIPSTKLGLPLKAGLPELAFTGNISAGVGMAAADSSTTKYLYRLQYHRYISSRPASRPFVAVRNPPTSSGTFANAVTVTVQLDYCAPASGLAVLRALLSQELGVVLP
ncbi:MAG: hypothetical protein C0395_02125 [Gemmatimonas sp.]|nr:hypothetical protein [Gemmatimonas sp.]